MEYNVFACMFVYVIMWQEQLGRWTSMNSGFNWKCNVQIILSGYKVYLFKPDWKTESRGA